MVWPFPAQLLSGKAWQNKERQLSFLCKSVCFRVDRSGWCLAGTWLTLPSSGLWSTLAFQLSHTAWASTITHQQYRHSQWFPLDALFSRMYFLYNVVALTLCNGALKPLTLLD